MQADSELEASEKQEEEASAGALLAPIMKAWEFHEYSS